MAGHRPYRPKSIENHADKERFDAAVAVAVSCFACVLRVECAAAERQRVCVSPLDLLYRIMPVPCYDDGSEKGNL